MIARREAGFTLVEVIAVLAIVGAIAALALPRWPQATTKPQLEAYALSVAALLKADRNAAVRRHERVAARLDAGRHVVVSGAGAGEVRLPADVGFDALLAETCEGGGAASEIVFLPSGMSCGGSVALARPGAAYHVRVNWLTGGVEIVAVDPPH